MAVGFVVSNVIVCSVVVFVFPAESLNETLYVYVPSAKPVQLIALGDVVRLKWSNISDGRLIYTMNKTSVTKSIKLLDKVKLIFEKYKKSESQKHIFPILPENSGKLNEFEIYRIISNQNAIINRDLKKIAKLIGTSTKISTHIARHSAADYLRSRNVDIFSISEFLGHSNIRITQNYLSSMKDSESDAILSEVFK